MNVLSNMLWLSKKALSNFKVEQLRKQFTAIGNSDIAGNPAICRMWAETPDWFGIPREARGSYSYTDKTVCPKKQWPKLVFPSGGKWREGQEDSVRAMVKYFHQNQHTGGRLEAKCGSGKTLQALAVAAELGVSTLVLLHKSDLAVNWKKDAQTFFPGVVVGHVQGDEWSYIGAHVTTCMVQTLWSRKGWYPKGFIEQFGMVIIDESHRFSAETFEYVLKVFPARYRLGVSATWRRRDGLEKAWEYHIGPKITTCRTENKAGRYVQIGLNIPLPGVHTKTPWAIVLNTLTRQSLYNSWLVEQIFQAVKKDRKVLAVSDRIDQLQEIKAMLVRKMYSEGINKTAGLYVGGMKAHELSFAKRADVILATWQMMSEGTDIPALDTLVMCSPRSDVEQVTGRIQRNYAGKKSLLVIDPIITSFRPYKILGDKRQKYYNKLGFVPALK